MAVALFMTLPQARGSDPAADRWLHAYVLVQAGQELADQDLWGLAMANYMAALKQFESLAEEFPSYQPRLVSYRRDDLKDRVREAGEKMTGAEHDLAMDYEDVIEKTRVGTKSRYDLDYQTSYQYLVRAQWLLSDLLERAPEKVVTALTKQRSFIDEMTEASRDSLTKEPGGYLKVHDIEKDFALSVSIAMSDLPSYRPVEPSASGMSSELFPDSLVAQVRDLWYQ